LGGHRGGEGEGCEEAECEAEWKRSTRRKAESHGVTPVEDRGQYNRLVAEGVLRIVGLKNARM
jgi:hypothetical protein